MWLVRATAGMAMSKRCNTGRLDRDNHLFGAAKRVQQTGHEDPRMRSGSKHSKTVPAPAPPPRHHQNPPAPPPHATNSESNRTGSARRKLCTQAGMY